MVRCEPLARTIPSAPAKLEVAEKPCQARAVMLSVRKAEAQRKLGEAGSTGISYIGIKVEQFRGSS